MSDFTHIHPDFLHIMGLSTKERLAFLDEPRWVGYDTAQLVMDSLYALMDKPKRPRMPNLLIVGDPNNGKTTIIRRFYDLCGTPYVNEHADPVKPVILAEAPPSADEKGLYISLLERFFAPYRASDSTAKLRYQVIHLFRACHVRLLVIDEFHSLLTGTAMKQREVMNAIKLLCNELCIPIVGVGTRVWRQSAAINAAQWIQIALRRTVKWTPRSGAGFKLYLQRLSQGTPSPSPSIVVTLHVCRKNLASSQSFISLQYCF